MTTALKSRNHRMHRPLRLCSAAAGVGPDSIVTNGTSQLIAQYGYDPLDRRLWKEQYRSMAGNPLAKAKRSYYLYADEGLIAEASQDISLNADGSVTATGTGSQTPNLTPVITTQYGPRPDSEFTTGLLFIKTKNTNGQDTVAYYHHDHLDTPIQATDKAGNIVWAASYNAFGQASITTPQATADRPTITSNLRLPGQYEDVETGLHYNWHRYYDAQIGRYVTSDPIGLLGGMNRYGYVGASPTKYIDPTGLFGVADLPLIPQPIVDYFSGFGSYYSGIGNAGSHMWRRSGGDGECEKKRAIEEEAILAAGLLSLSNPAISAAAYGAAKNWAQNNKSYIAGRFTAGGVTGTITGLGLPGGIGLGTTAAMGDALNSVRSGADNPEQILRAILGDKSVPVPAGSRTKCECNR